MEKKRRTYDLPPDVLAELERLKNTYAKDKVTAAGIRLFAKAPADLREAAVAGDDAFVQAWFSRSIDIAAVAMYEQVRREAQAAAEGKSGRKGSGGETR